MALLALDDELFARIEHIATKSSSRTVELFVAEVLTGLVAFHEKEAAQPVSSLRPVQVVERPVRVQILFTGPSAEEPPPPPPVSSREEGKYLTVKQAADRAQMSMRSIYAWAHEGKIEFVRTASGRIRIVEESLWRAK